MYTRNNMWEAAHTVAQQYMSEQEIAALYINQAQQLEACAAGRAGARPRNGSQNLRSAGGGPDGCAVFLFCNEVCEGNPLNINITPLVLYLGRMSRPLGGGGVVQENQTSSDSVFVSHWNFALVLPKPHHFYDKI